MGMPRSTIILLAYCFAMTNVLHAAILPIQKLPTIGDIERVMSLDNPAEKMKFMQKYGVDTIEHLLKFAQNTVDEVDEMVRQSEAAIKRLREESKDLNLEEIEFTNTYIAKYNEAKVKLLEARRELVALASETVHICEQIEIGITDWQDEHAVVLLKHQFLVLERLIEKTKTRLTNAKEKYTALINTWIDMDKNIAIFKTKLNHMSDSESEEYQKFVTTIRASYISGASALTVGMVIADIFGCFGICSGTITTITWASVAASAESAIAKYKAEVKALENQVDNAINQLGKLDQTTKAATRLMTTEMNLVIRWQSAAKVVEDTIDGISYEQLQVVKGFQNIFAHSIAKLKAAAQGYYDFASSDQQELQYISNQV